ncbi:MAG: molybdopterin molybdotransferase MoeA [Saprospiraceae bacterium]
MITIQQATKIVLENRIDLPTEIVKLENAIGRQLREDLIADRPFPPFNRVAMDGIAIRFSDFENGQRTFPIVGVQAAGSPQLEISKNGVCAEVMTGSMLPKGVDTVIRYEDVLIENNQATIQIETIRNGQNIHKKGTDRVEGDILVNAGKIISSAEIGVAATVGKSELHVTKLPKVAIISTGDELVNIDETPEPYQIRSSNVYTISSLLQQHQIQAELFHIVDNQEATIDKLKILLNDFDVLILSGGVSKGKFDYIPAALEALKVEKLFHRVRQKPGKPFWFGKNENNKVVFALPGNPASAFMCTNRYFLPWLRASMNVEPFDYQYITLAEDFYFKANLQYFLQVKINYNTNGQVTGKPIAGRGSGDLANLADVDGFLELPAEKTEFKKGEIYPFIRFR